MSLASCIASSSVSNAWTMSDRAEDLLTARAVRWWTWPQHRRFDVPALAQAAGHHPWRPFGPAFEVPATFSKCSSDARGPNSVSDRVGRPCAWPPPAHEERQEVVVERPFDDRREPEGRSGRRSEDRLDRPIHRRPGPHRQTPCCPSCRPSRGSHAEDGAPAARMPARAGLTREGDEVDTLVVGERFARLQPVPLHHVQHTWREAASTASRPVVAPKPVCPRLVQHNGIAECERRCDLPRLQHGRKFQGAIAPVPRGLKPV